MVDPVLGSLTPPACLLPVLKAFLLIHVLDSWTASRIKTLGFSSLSVRSLSRTLLSLVPRPLSFRVTSSFPFSPKEPF
ncbi:hypothetical protein TNCV_3178571 [Trichonephila clavipes]|nr:hypothetical protein TNCV_3178571 [Trichonephila clavipes]